MGFGRSLLGDTRDPEAPAITAMAMSGSEVEEESVLVKAAYIKELEEQLEQARIAQRDSERKEASAHEQLREADNARIEAEENAQKALKGAEMALESAEAARCSALAAEAARKNSEAKFESAKAQLLHLRDVGEQALQEAEGARMAADKEAKILREVQDELNAAEAALALKEKECEDLKANQIELQDLRPKVASLEERLREKEGIRKALIAEKEQLQKELKSHREQQRRAQKKFEEDDAEKKRLLQQATNAKAELEKLKKEVQAGKKLERDASHKTLETCGNGKKLERSASCGNSKKLERSASDKKLNSKDNGDKATISGELQRQASMERGTNSKAVHIAEPLHRKSKENLQPSTACLDGREKAPGAKPLRTPRDRERKNTAHSFVEDEVGATPKEKTMERQNSEIRASSVEGRSILSAIFGSRRA